LALRCGNTLIPHASTISHFIATCYKSQHAESRSARQAPPPRRVVGGADAITIAEQKIADLPADIDSNRELSTSLTFDV
jgi:hypothetical protein